jgi:hypothetical protein
VKLLLQRRKQGSKAWLTDSSRGVKRGQVCRFAGRSEKDREGKRQKPKGKNGASEPFGEIEIPY